MKKTLLLIFAAALSLSMSAETVDDVLNQTATNVTGSTYADFTYTGTSGIVYAGQCAGSNESIQLRSDTSKGYSGVVSTTTVGYARKLAVVWNENTADDRTLNVYGSNTAYTAATDLYDSSAQGTLLGTIVYGTSTELEISGDYAYIGFRSNSGAMYLTSVTITWELDENAGGGQGGGETTDPEEPTVDLTDPYTSNVTWTAGDDHAYVDQTASIGEGTYDILKLGTSSATGYAYTTLPAGTQSFAFYCVGWKNTTDTPFTVTLDGIGEKSYTANANSGLSSNSPYELSTEELSDDDYYVITFDALTEATTLTIETTSSGSGRIGVFGAKYYASAMEGGDTLDEITNDEGYTTTGKGTVDDPYTVADALAIIDAGTYTTDNVYVKGTVSQIDEISTSYGNATYYISDDGTTADQLEVFRGYYLGGAKFTSEDDLKVGDVVVVCGALTLYSSTPEITTGSSIYSIDGVTAPEEGEVDMDDPYTSNTTWTAIEHAEVNDVAKIGDNEYLLVKLGTSSAAGSAFTTLPAGTTTFVFYCVSWGTKGDTPYTVTLDGGAENSFTANANSGMNNNSPFEIAVDELTDDDYHVITFDALTEDTNLTVATGEANNGRIGIFGAKYYSDTTGIHAIDAATAVGNGEMYNLSGQKVTESYRGIVIVNGKKYLNK